MSEKPPGLTIIGTGAMACLLAARLAPVARVTLAGSWPEGLEAIRSRGIQVEGPGERSHVSVDVSALEEASRPADLILVVVKAWQTAAVAPHAARLLAPAGIALTLQNGLGNLEILGGRACQGVTYLGATMLGPGRVRPAGRGTTWIAGPEWVVALFRRAGLPAERCAADQAEGLLWGKLAVNCGINALTAILRVPNGELLRLPDTETLLRAAAAECGAVAAAKGITLPFPDPGERACQVVRQTAANLSSMLQDLLRGAPTECEAINGAIVEWARRLGVAAPVNEFLLRLVRAAAARARTAPHQEGSETCWSSQVSKT